MVTSIQLGNLFNTNGKTVISGGASAIDVEGLIKGLSEAKRQPAVILEGKVELNTKRSESLAEMKQLLEDFRDASDFLRNPPGVQNAADNIFQYRKAAITTNSGVAGSSYINVTAEPGTAVGQYDIQINSLATRNVQTTNTFAIADTNTALVGQPGSPLTAGPLTLGAGGTTVNLTANDTLAQVAAKINAVKDQSGVEASIVKISNGNYRLSFKTLETGTAQNYDLATLNPGNFTGGFALQSNAIDASMTIDGTTVTRSSDNIADLVEGMTFNLLGTTPPGTDIAVDIDSDKELAKQGIVNFVDAFNAFRLFASKQTEIGTNGRPTEDAVLAGNKSLSLAMSRVNLELAQAVEGLAASDPSRLSDLGITFKDYPGDEETPFTRNILSIDEDKLDSAIESNFDAVRKVFEFDMVSEDANLSIFSRGNGLSISAFTLNIDQVGGTYTATYDVGGVPTNVALTKTDLGGGSIVLAGQQGTVLEGLTMIYASTASGSFDVNISQGIGDRLFNSLDDLLDEESGVVSTALTQVEEESVRYEEEIVKIDEQIEKFRDAMLTKFSALEQTISQMNTLLQSLDAQASARENG